MTETANFLETLVTPPGAALDLPIEISFVCHGCRFGVVAEESPDGVVVTGEGIVAVIPFSAESLEARAKTKTLLASRPASVIVRLELAARNRIMLRG